MIALADKVDHGFTRWSKRGGLLLLGWFACSIYHGTLTAAKVEKTVPALQAQAGCEAWRARVASKLALDTTVVAPSQIPKDNCPRPSVPSAERP